MRVEGVVKLICCPFAVIDALAHVIILFEMEHRRLRLESFAAQMVHDRREDCHRLSEEHVTAEDDFNEGLGCVRALVGDTAAATSALSCGTNDRDDNELKYLQEALCLVDGLLGRRSHNEHELITVESSPSP